MIQIELKVKKNTQTAHRFCRYLLKHIKRDMRSTRRLEALQARLDLIENATWIEWIGKPQKVDARNFINLVCSCLSYTVRYNTFIIYLDDRIMLPSTNTSVCRIVRYIDFGNELIPGCMYFTSILSSYKKLIQDLWWAFKVKTMKP